MLVLAMVAAAAGAQPPGRPGPYGHHADKQQWRGGGDRQQYRRESPGGGRQMSPDERRELRRELDQANEEIYKRKR